MDCARAVDDNLTTLVELDEKTLLESIRNRYLAGRIYTDVGDILLAVNPFKALPIYSEEWSRLYSISSSTSDGVDNLVPHIFSVAAKSFSALLQTKRNQVCVISGESGAGKTESTKLIIHQLMKMCKSSHFGTQLQNRILQVNPVLESFGNAKTVLNNNSSRFGKFIQLMFTSNGRIVGGGLDQYLLEKSRVCFQGDGESNYHIFYYLLDGLDSLLSAKLSLNGCHCFRYICCGRNITGNIGSAENKLGLAEVTQSMKDIGFTNEEIDQIFTILATILHVGDIEFQTNDSSDDSSFVSSKEKVDIISQLLKLEHSDDLCFALTTLRTTTRGETVDKLYSTSKAGDVRDALAKALYSRMFHWLVSRINNYIAPDDAGSYVGIGILDIFGFESFKRNSFEQFCINVANEQLQQYFNTQIFAMEKEEYIKEGITGVDISFQDNQPVLELFLSRPLGLISLLDEQCRTNGNESRLLERYRQSFQKHPHYMPDRGSALIFTVQHYAGKVEYCAEGFLDKNRDSLPEPVQGLLKFSGLRLVRNLFHQYPNFSGSVMQSASRLRPTQRSVLKKMSVRRKKSSHHKRGRGHDRKKVVTVSGHFRDSLQSLMERILSATPHFVRCFKPNPMKVSFEFDSDFVAKQLKYTGMLEAVRVRREGFAYRPFFSDFVGSYKNIAFKLTDKSIHSSHEVCQKILKSAGLTGWKIGKSRVFLRYFHEEALNSMLHDMEMKAIQIQSVFRGFRTRKRCKSLFEAMKIEHVAVERLLKDVYQHSEECFARVIELNKSDVLHAVERFGHPNKSDDPLLSSADDEPDHSNGLKRKFKPKAVGGVAILLDSRIAAEYFPKKEQRDNASSRHLSVEQQQDGYNGTIPIMDTNVSGKGKSKAEEPIYSVPHKVHIKPTTINPTEIMPHSTPMGSHKRIPPPVSPKPKHRMNIHLTAKVGNTHHSTFNEDRVPVKEDKAVSTAPSQLKSLSINNPQVERQSSVESDYMDMSGEFSTLDLPHKKRNPLGAEKPSSLSSSMKDTNSSVYDQLTPAAPPQEFGLMFSNGCKVDSNTECTVIPDDTAGAMVKPNPVKTYTILTMSPEHSLEPDVEYMEVLPLTTVADDDDDSEEGEYVLPCCPTGDSNCIYTNRVTGSVEDLTSYIDMNGLCRQKSSSLDGKLLQQVRTTSSPEERSRSFGTNYTKIIHNSPSSNFSVQRGLSSSVPDLLSIASSSAGTPTERKLSNGDQGLSLESPLLHRVSLVSTSSGNSSNSITPTQTKQKKKRLGKLFRKKKNKEKCDKINSYSAAVEGTHASSVNPSELPGYLPGISEHDAAKILSGKLPGVYVIYTDYTSNGNFVFKLAVSQGQGRRVWSSTIEPQPLSNGENGLFLVLNNSMGNGTAGSSNRQLSGGSQQLFLSFEALSMYYRSHPLTESGLRLSTPVAINPQIAKDNKMKKKKKPVPLPVNH